jgi:hypothetical protein
MKVMSSLLRAAAAMALAMARNCWRWGSLARRAAERAISR